MVNFILFIILFTYTCIFCFTPPRRQYKSISLIPQKIKAPLNRYRLYIYSSGAIRQSLMLIVILSLYYTITEPFKSELIKNLSYSLIATFIFDTGLNFSKENITKSIVSRKWHNSLYFAFERLRAIHEIFTAQNKLEFTKELASDMASSILMENGAVISKKHIKTMWNPSSGEPLTYQDIVIKEGDNLYFASMMFIRDDYEFLHSIYFDENIFLSFPQLLKPAQKCYRSLAMIQHNINSKQKFNVTKKSLERDLINYLELRSTLLMKMEGVLGHYEQRAPQ